MKSLVLTLSAAFILASCGSNSSNSGSNSTSSVFQMADNAFSSAASIATGNARTMSSVTCNNTGTPSGVNAGDDGYAEALIICASTINSKSPDTLKGSYYIASTAFCAIRKQVTLSFPSVATTHDGLSLTESDSCTGAGGWDMDNSGTVGDFTQDLSIKQSALTAQDYDTLLEIEFNATWTNTPNVKIYFKSSGNILAAKIYAIGEAVTEIVIDKTAKTVKFENRDYNGERHIRTYIAGTMNANTGSFTSLSNLQLIHSGDGGHDDTTIAYGYNGANEWVDYWNQGVQVTGHGYPKCQGTCAALTITHSANFYNFAGNAQTNYNNSSLLNFTVPLNMNF